MNSKEFKVVSVSTNHNSFGLQGMILMAANGEAWEVAANYINIKNKGDIIKTRTYSNGEPDFAGFGFEIPRRLPDAPSAVIEQVFGALLMK